MSSIQQNTGVTFERKSGVTLHRKIGVSLERKTGVTFSGISNKYNVSEKVAQKLYDELQKCYNNLAINPFYQIRTKCYRALPLESMPYLIFFEVVEDEMLVRILSVFNTYQDPDKWP